MNLSLKRELYHKFTVPENPSLGRYVLAGHVRDLCYGKRNSVARIALLHRTLSL